MARFFVVLVLSWWAQSLNAETLVMSIGKIQQAKGSLVIAVFERPDKWLDTKAKNAAFRKVIYPVVDLTDASVRISDLPEGRFAISVFHDLDNNNKLETNFIGYPKEPFGFSAPMGRFGPPSFEDASFVLGGEAKSGEIMIGIELH